VLAFHT